MCFECSLSDWLLNNNNQNGDSALRYLCRTNAYGPTDSIFHDCHRFEAGSASASGQIRMFSLFSSKCTSAPNPSLSEPLCMKFAKVCCFFSILVLQFLKGKVFEEKSCCLLSVFHFPKEVASTGRLKEDFSRDKRVDGLDDITPAKVFIIVGIIKHLMKIILAIVVEKIFILRWFWTRQRANRYLASRKMSQN